MPDTADIAHFDHSVLRQLPLHVDQILENVGCALIVFIRQHERIVDEHGVLLPKKAPVSASLPILFGAPRPTGGEGQPWGDPSVAGAAQTAALLQPHGDKWGLNAMTRSGQGLILWAPGLKVIWGQQPRGSKEDELSNVAKEEKLMDFLTSGEAPLSWWLWMREFDLRPRQGPSSQWIWLQTPES